MKVAVFGATGPAGKLVVENALAAGHEVVVFARNPEKLGKLTERVAVVKGELTDEAAIESALHEVEAVVSLLGPTSGKVMGTPVADGTGRILEAMQRVGVRRIVAISTPSSPDPKDKFDPLVWFPKMLVKLLVPAGLHDILKTSDVVRGSDRDWTLVRAQFLTNAPGTGHVRVGYPGQGIVKASLGRSDLAAYMVRQLSETTYVRQAPAVSN